MFQTTGGSDLPRLGTRFALSGYIGTIKYVGGVEGTSGVWLGVEWDDSNRGKHDGIKDGQRYFACLSAGAGSFIRPLPSLQYGKTFLEALTGKYIEQLHGSDTQETVILGSSNGAIRVEAVNLDKIRGKFASLESLQEVSLDKENVFGPDAPGETRKRCPNIKAVDLSHSLIPSWDDVALIATELPSLERLALNNNRLWPPSDLKLVTDAFSCIVELQLNATFMTWQAILDVITLMPRLDRLESGYNRLRALTPLPPRHPVPAVTTINLDCNQLSGWAETFQALSPFQKLVRLILSSNLFDAIPVPTDPQIVSKLTHLSLSLTGISKWSSIDSLNLWCPDLESLSLNGTPLLEDSQLGRVWQQIVIARLPRLRTLDGTSVSVQYYVHAWLLPDTQRLKPNFAQYIVFFPLKITPRHRVDAELFYLSRIARESHLSDAARNAAHPRWVELCELHDTPDIDSGTKTKGDKLKNHLIEIKASLSSVSPPSSAPQALMLTKPVKVLSSASLRNLRLKLLKLFKVPRDAESELWIRTADGQVAPLGDNAGTDDDKEIDWWVGNDSEVLLYVKK
ncbi:hypothetical protein EDB89DRAFT_2238261 [Lactarius sanguifluus]|nr:hypothetical protein EDB89DRAFT_2238261 [Lactarius sanguifluus]